MLVLPLPPGEGGGEGARQVESTWSFLFALPVVLTAAWLMTIFGRDLLREVRMLRNVAVEFGIAAVIAFAIFYLSIDRAVTALLLGL